MQLQERVPKAKVLYTSATALSKLPELAYMGERLALWGEGLEFISEQVSTPKLKL